MKKIVVITRGYPCPATPTLYAFTKELVTQWRSFGMDVQVINPLPAKDYKICKDISGRDNVYFPKFRRFRALKAIPFLRYFRWKLEDRSYQKAVERCLENRKDQLLYGKFLDSALSASVIGKKRGLNVYCDFGESSLWSIKYAPMDEVLRRAKTISGFVSVSGANTEMLTESGIASEEKILTAINGVNGDVIRRLDKKECREQLGFPGDAVIGLFLGLFIDRKGPLRVAEATKDIPGLKMIYIGEGEQKPSGDNIIHCGPVLHEDIARYLSAADFFILPTLAEGCCNAIVEAVVCGLPVISSRDSFNDEILEDAYSLRVDPSSVPQLREAVEKLVSDDALRESMSRRALEKGREYRIDDRAKRILRFIGAELPETNQTPEGKIQ